MASSGEPPLGRRSRSWLAGFVDAARGMGLVWRTERNLRVQAAVGWAALLLAVATDASALRLAVLAALVAVVLAGEVMNTALEVSLDLLSPQRHPLAGAAKDMGAGAVLTLSAGALAVGLFLFWPEVRRPLHTLMVAWQLHPWLCLVGGAGELGLLAAALASLPARPRP